MAKGSTNVDLNAVNAMVRNAIVGNAVKMEQQIFSKSVNPATENVLNVQPRYAGLILGFVVEVVAEINNADTATADAQRTIFGTANLVKQFRFDDLSNYTRLQTSGRHLALLNTVRQGFGFGGSYANNIPMGYGVNFDVYDGPASITDDATAPVRQVYYVPVSYSNTDLRGAIYASVVNATMNLQITLNDTPGYTTGNPVNAIYGGADTVVSYDGNVTVNVYQIYLDQLPVSQNGQVMLPPLDLNTVYDIKETTFGGVTAGQDFPMAYSSFRQFLSTIAIYDNGGSFGDGSDVNYWSLQAANFSNIFKVSPNYSALKTRGLIMSDLPLGTYLFSSRDIPINTINFGNMELNLNAVTANSGARVIVGYEAFGLVNQLVGAPSLQA